VLAIPPDDQKEEPMKLKLSFRWRKWRLALSIIL
jgi:hypothetical protein